MKAVVLIQIDALKIPQESTIAVFVAQKQSTVHKLCEDWMDKNLRNSAYYVDKELYPKYIIREIKVISE